jgi:hypothetical protein
MLARLYANRILRRPVSLVSGLLLATGLLTTGLVFATAPAASAAVPIKICLTYSSSYCADVKDGHHVSGNPVWLWRNGANSRWLLVTGVTCIAGSNCYEFQDAVNTHLCLTATVGRSIVLGTCNGGRGSWYSEGGNLYGNGGYGASYTLMVRSTVDGSPLVALPAHRAGYWEQWSL